MVTVIVFFLYLLAHFCFPFLLFSKNLFERMRSRLALDNLLRILRLQYPVLLLIEICVVKTSVANYQLRLCSYHYCNLVPTRLIAAIIVGIQYCLGSGILWRGRKSYEEGIFLVLFVDLFLWARIDYCSEDFVFWWYSFFLHSVASLREMKKNYDSVQQRLRYYVCQLVGVIRSLPSALLQSSAVKDV